MASGFQPTPGGCRSDTAEVGVVGSLELLDPRRAAVLGMEDVPIAVDGIRRQDPRTRCRRCASSRWARWSAASGLRFRNDLIGAAIVDPLLDERDVGAATGSMPAGAAAELGARRWIGQIAAKWRLSLSALTRLEPGRRTIRRR